MTLGRVLQTIESDLYDLELTEAQKEMTRKYLRLVGSIKPTLTNNKILLMDLKKAIAEAKGMKNMATKCCKKRYSEHFDDFNRGVEYATRIMLRRMTEIEGESFHDDEKDNPYNEER